jgi:hypothetical protein
MINANEGIPARQKSNLSLARFSAARSGKLLHKELVSEVNA